MPDYDDVAELLLEITDVRHELKQLRAEYFSLRQSHFGQSQWWTRAGAGSPHQLAGALHDALAEDRSDLRDYWYYPSGKHNPYLDLLYASMPEHGFRPRELADLVGLASLPSGSIVHLHWIESLRPNGDDAAQNLEALGRARRRIETFVSDRANRLVWSIHEPLPHGTAWPDHDADFHQFLADTADVIHVLHPATADACAEFFTIDESRVVCAELPLYTGVYASFRSRASARALLGVADDELCVVFFGAIRAYKGLEVLLDAIAGAAADRPLRLLIAGMPVGAVDSMLERVEQLDQAAVAPMLVPDSEIQTLLGAADVVVVPYERFLNSAVLMLALSFGVPVIATENAVTLDARASGMVTTYRTTGQLADALRTAAVEPELSIDPEYALAHDPQRLSDAFATEMLARLRALPS